jgi:tellurite resistance-related uncharacterized protein
MIRDHRRPEIDIPAELAPYKRSSIFTLDTLPAALLKDHSTKAGCWALILVLEGEIGFVIEDSRRPYAKTVLRQELLPGLVEPTILHRLEPMGPVKLQIEFYRQIEPSMT